jgi:replicative DNA helicase
MSATATTDLIVPISLLDHEHDNRPKLLEMPWTDLVLRFAQADIRLTKEGGRAWTPATFPKSCHRSVYPAVRTDGSPHPRAGQLRPWPHRANENVDRIVVAVLDLEKFGTDGFTDVATRLRPWEHVIHSTFSHTPETPRWRAAVPLSYWPTAEEWVDDYWARLNAALTGGRNDVQTKDPARLYFFPAHPASVEPFFRHHEGRLLDPRELPSAPTVTAADAESGVKGATTRGAVDYLGYATLDFVAHGAPDGEQRGRALGATRAYLAAGYSVEDTAGQVWKGLQASPCGNPADPWTYDHALAFAEDLARRRPPRLAPWAGIALEPTDGGAGVVRVPSPAKQANSANSGNSANAPASWESPTPLLDVPRPPFPTDALPTWLRAWVAAESEAMQTPTDLAGMLSLSVLSTVCAKKVAVRVRDGWTEPVNTYVVAALPPGERKSPVFTAATEPLEDYEQDVARDMEPEIARAQNRYKIAEQALTRAQGDAARAKADEQPALIAEADHLARELAELEVPVRPRLIVDDVSPERLATLLRDHGGRIAVLSAEGDIFEVMAGRYAKGGAPNLGVFLKGHAGDPLRVDRVGRPPEYIRAPALTLGLAVQPDVILGLQAKPGFRGRGLLARLNYALPLSLLGRRKTKPRPVPAAVRAAYHHRILALLQLPTGTDAEGAPSPHILTLGSDAASILEQFEAEVEPRLGELGDLGHMTDWGGKLVGNVVRHAGLLHMAKHAGGSAPWGSVIEGATMEAAISIGHYLTAHAKAAYAAMGADPVVEDARYLVRWIARLDGGESFSRREIFEATKGRFKRVEALDPPLNLLETHGYIRQQTAEPRTGPGRPPSPIYAGNPMAFAEFARFAELGDVGISANSANSANGVAADRTGGHEAEEVTEWTA